MQVTARVTGDAVVTTLKDERQVVNFSVAVNDTYKVKGLAEPVKITEYIRCAYWRSTGVAQFLTKGAIVELEGRIGINAYTGTNGEAKANLTLHVNSIKIHSSSNSNKKENAKNETTPKPKLVTTKVSDEDLPF